MIKELPDGHPLKGAYVYGIYDPDAVTGWTDVSTKEIVDKINELVREVNRLFSEVKEEKSGI